MKTIFKNGIGVIAIYALAILCTFLVSDRVNELDSKTDLRNSNSSIVIKLSR